MEKRNSAIYLVIIAVIALVAAKQFSRMQPTADRKSSAPAPTVLQKPADFGKGLLSGADMDKSLKSNRPTLAEFGKGTCDICQKMQPILKEIAKKHTGNLNVVSVDLDEYANLARTYHISAMPTQIFFDAKGKIVNRHIGYIAAADIEKELAGAGAKR
jgi:thioredoxin 1